MMFNVVDGYLFFVFGDVVKVIFEWCVDGLFILQFVLECEVFIVDQYVDIKLKLK